MQDKENLQDLPPLTDQYVLRVFMPKASKPIRYAGFDRVTKKPKLVNIHNASVFTKAEGDDILANLPNVANATYTVMRLAEAQEREKKRADRLNSMKDGI